MNYNRNEMKDLLLFTIIAIGLFGCASQKKVPDALPQSTYTTDYTVTEKEEVAPADTLETPKIKIHIVKKGESLWVIAKKYGVTVSDLVEANHIADKNIIKINRLISDLRIKMQPLWVFLYVPFFHHHIESAYPISMCPVLPVRPYYR